MPKLKPGTTLPTPQEDAAILAGMASDPDNPEWTAQDFAQAKPASEALPSALYDALVAKRPRGRPKAEQTKQALTVRYDADIVAAFKATGKGWQTRMNEALRDWLKTHSPA